MQNVREIAEEIVAREGGYVNDPDDPGGATKYGVTIHTMRRLGLDLTGDGVVGVADVQALRRDQAVDIFIQHYFQRPRIAELPKRALEISGCVVARHRRGFSDQLRDIRYGIGSSMLPRSQSQCSSFSRS